MVLASRVLLMLAALAASTLLSGCAHYACCTESGQLVATSYPIAVDYQHLPACSGAACRPVVQSAAAAPTKLLAVGYGNVGGFTQYSSQGQQALMAMRAARVDAYRNLAEQVLGFRVWGNTSVSAFVTQNDSVRTHVDAFIRGARVVNVANIGDGNYEVTVELEVSPQFTKCLVDQRECGMRTSTPACVAGGCSAPSATYVSY